MPGQQAMRPPPASRPVACERAATREIAPSCGALHSVGPPGAPVSEHERWLELQRGIGNQAVMRLLARQAVPRPLPGAAGTRFLQRKCACGVSSAGGECDECRTRRLGLQTKLAIGPPGDAYEQEADRVAEQVTALPADPDASRVPPRIERLAGNPNRQPGAAPTSVDRALAGPGRPLDPVLRQDMEQRFGYDFARVRLHLGAAAGESARDVDAHAYTVGNNIVFGTDRFAPGTHEGRRLIAHELTHVVQQSAANGIARDRTVGGPGPAAIASVLQRRPNEKLPATADDPIEEDNFPEYAWHLVATTNGRGSPPFPVIRAVVAENTQIDRDVLAAATASFHYRNHVQGGTIRPSYFSFRHPTKGVVARAFAELQGYHPERKPDPKALLKEDHSYEVYIFSPRAGATTRTYAFPMPLSSAPLLPEYEQEQTPEPEPESRPDVELTIADLGTDLTPWVSNIKDGFIAATGINPVTGEKVGIAGRIISGIFAIPGLGNILKYIGKGAKGLGRGIKWFGKLLRGEQARRKVATLHLLIRLGGTGLNRALIKEFGKEGVERLARGLGPELTAQLAKELGPQTLKQAVDRLGVEGVKELAEKGGSQAVKKVLSRESEKAVTKTEEKAAERAEKTAEEKALGEPGALKETAGKIHGMRQTKGQAIAIVEVRVDGEIRYAAAVNSSAGFSREQLARLKELNVEVLPSFEKEVVHAEANVEAWLAGLKSQRKKVEVLRWGISATRTGGYICVPCRRIVQRLGGHVEEFSVTGKTY